MKKTTLFVLTILFSIGPLFFSGCDSSEATPEAGKNDKKFALVKTSKFEAGNFTGTIDLLGIAKASKSANLSAEEGGKILRYLKSKGEFVKAGETILEIDNLLLKSNMDAAKANYDLAEVNFQKLERVYKENASSELAYLQAKYQRDGAKANYDLMKSRYEKTFIKAPFNGYFDEKYAEEGEVVAPGQAVLSLVNSSEVKIVVGVPENYVAQIKQGEKVKVRFKDLNGLELTSRITYIGKTINPSNRTFSVEILLPNQNNLIKPELNAEVSIQQDVYTNIVSVPENLLLKTDAGFVLFVEKNGVAEQRVVEVLGRSGNKVALKSGVTADDNVVTVGYQGLVPGENLKVVN